MRTVTLRYYSYHLLRMLDVNQLLDRLASEVPDVVRVVIEGMPEEECSVAAQAGVDGIIMVRERIHIFVRDDGGHEERRRDLEAEVERFSP